MKLKMKEQIEAWFIYKCEKYVMPPFNSIFRINGKVIIIDIHVERSKRFFFDDFSAKHTLCAPLKIMIDAPGA